MRYLDPPEPEDINLIQDSAPERKKEKKNTNSLGHGQTYDFCPQRGMLSILIGLLLVPRAVGLRAPALESCIVASTPETPETP